MRLLIVYVLALLAGVAFCSEPAVIGNMVNSDLVMPVALSHEVWRGQHAALFQLSRAPSLFPDLVAEVGLGRLFDGWQALSVAYAAVAFMGLVAVLGAVAGRIARCPAAVATPWVLGASIAAMGADNAWFGSMHPMVLALTPAVHSGSMLLAFAGLLLVERWVGRRGWVLEGVVFGVSLLGTLSDRLFVGTFVLPVLGVLALLVLVRQLGLRPAVRIGLVVVVGCVVGMRVDRVLFAQVLLRQGDVSMGLVGRHFALLVRSPTLLPLLAIEAGLLAMAAVAWRRFGVGVFWAGTFLVMTAGHLVLYAALYSDDALLRYVQPVFWWGVVWFAAAGARFGGSVGGWAAAAAALAGLVVVETGRADPVPAVMAYRSPLTACLREAHAAGRLHDGLAEYWVARPIEVAADWTLQVDQINTFGFAFLWGNNRFWYAHARSDPARPPMTDFIVMQRLDEDAIRERFGPPASVLRCPDSDVWLYPASVHDAVGGIRTAGQRDPALVRAACFRARDYKTEGAGGQVTVTRVEKGPWRVRLRYRLTGPGRWDVFGNADHVYASGELPRSGAMDADIDLPRAVQGFEFRVRPGEGGAFGFESLALMPGGGAPDPCS